MSANRRSRAIMLVSLAGVMLGAASDQRPAQPVEPGMTANGDDWPSWGRNGLETHYSPLAQITAGNVADLKLAWHFDLEPGYTATVPLEAEGKVFITTQHSHIRAFAAVSGKLLWEYDGGTTQRRSDPLALSWGNKGIAYANHKVFLETTDGFVVALDANTGQEVWKVQDFPDAAPRNANGAPRVFAGKVIVGFGGADISPARGFVTAYDAETGKRAWRFYTVPGDPSQPPADKAEQVERATWHDWIKPDGTRRGGGGTAWNAFSYDPELNLIYLGVGNGFPYNQALRSPGGGDNLFLASIVAVNADTGAYVWHYQVTPGEQWDSTATMDMTLATLKIDGKDRKVLMQAPKNGFFYVIDRTTGKLISAEKIAKVTWASSIDLKTGRPIENPGIRYAGKPGLFELWPGPSGAHSWPPQAYSPQTGLVYIPVMENGALIGDGQKGGSASEMGAGMGATLVPVVDLPGGNRSFLKAWNPVTQQAAWQVQLPGDWPGGVMASAGNLVFQGRIDGNLVAYNAATGAEVWHYQTESPIVGAPISYRVGGKQYVTVITGNGGNGAGITSPGNAAYRTDYRLPRRVLTFAIGGTDTIAPFTMPALEIPDDPGYKADGVRAMSGAMKFATNACIVCHGWNAIGGGAAPDLRYSPMIVDAEAFKQVVKGGALVANAMPKFAQISDDDLETIRFYLRMRSKAAPADQAAALARARAVAVSSGK